MKVVWAIQAIIGDWATYPSAYAQSSRYRCIAIVNAGVEPAGAGA